MTCGFQGNQPENLLVVCHTVLKPCHATSTDSWKIERVAPSVWGCIGHVVIAQRNLAVAALEAHLSREPANICLSSSFQPELFLQWIRCCRIHCASSGPFPLQVQGSVRRALKTVLMSVLIGLLFALITRLHESFPLWPCSLMSRKTTRLTNLDASVLEAEMRCGTEWPIGLIDAIAQAHQTTVRCVTERRRVLRPTVWHDPYNPHSTSNS